MNTKALLLALGLGLATNVYAHPRVISATPAENEILASAPTNIRIEFTERPVAKFSGIELLDARNQAVPLGPSELLAKDSKVLVAPIARTRRLHRGLACGGGYAPGRRAVYVSRAAMILDPES
jgi:methionine-rich copper-binding protein CopC